jgi:hypothetical protein
MLPRAPYTRGYREISVPQPLGCGPVPGPGIKYTSPSSYKKIMWRIGPMQELLRHRGLGARAQRESCGLYRRVAKRQPW